MASGKLYYVWSPMNSGKSLQLVAKTYNFKERNIPVLIIKPSLDDRDKGKIFSRALSTKLECGTVTPEDNIYEMYYNECLYGLYKWMLVDEAQFLTEEQVDQLAHLVDETDVNIICYGLRTDFKTKLFPGSKRLFEIADKFEELKSTCQCGNKALINARIDSNGYVVEDGPQVECGAEDKYITLCRKCYYKAIREHLKISEL